MTAGRIQDREVRILASLAGTMKSDYAADDLAWEGSPFAWIKQRPSRQRGKIGEMLVAGWCASRGLDVTKAHSVPSWLRLWTGWEVQSDGGFSFSRLEALAQHVSAHCSDAPAGMWRP